MPGQVTSGKSASEQVAEIEVTETAEGLEAALYDYLDRLIYERDVQSVLPVDNEATLRETGDGWRVGLELGRGTRSGERWIRGEP